jgi:hypothetical protein
MVEPSGDKTPSSPPAQEESPAELAAQVDRLVENVEALAGLVSRETERKPAPPVPARDPAAETAADDRGLSSASPLIQDGERMEIDEIVADVELALDRTRRDLQSIGIGPPAAEGDVDARPDDPHDVETATRPDERSVLPGTPDADSMLDELERLVALTEEQQDQPAADAAEPRGPVEAAAAGAGAASSDLLAAMNHVQSLAEDLGLEVLAHSASAECPAPLRGPAAIAAGETAGPVSKAAAQVETELQRLERLLADLDPEHRPPCAPDPSGAQTAVAPPGESADEEGAAGSGPAAFAGSITNGPGGDSPPQEGLEAMVLTRGGPAAGGRQTMIRRPLAVLCDPLVSVLDVLDRPFRGLSPRTKEILGCCALVTLAMSLVAALVYSLQ